MKPLPDHTCLSVFLDISLSEIEWDIPVSNFVRQKLRRKANKIGRRIIADWLQDAKAKAEKVADMIARDEVDQRRRDQLIAASNDLDDSVRIANQMAAEAMPKPHRSLNRKIKRERQRLERDGRRLAKLKLARLGRR